jgi:hypothetical protein
MRRDLEYRLEVLEEKAKPRVISTLVDLVIYANEDSDEEVELSPEMAALVEDLSKRCKENRESQYRPPNEMNRSS